MINDDMKLSYTFTCPKCHSKIVLNSTVHQLELHVRARDLIFRCMRCKREHNALTQDYELLTMRLREKGCDL